MGKNISKSINQSAQYFGLEALNVKQCGLFNDTGKPVSEITQAIIDNTPKAVDVRNMQGDIVGLAHDFYSDGESVFYNLTGNNNWKEAEVDYIIPSKIGVSFGEAGYGKGQWPAILELTATWVDWFPGTGV